MTTMPPTASPSPFTAIDRELEAPCPSRESTPDVYRESSIVRIDHITDLVSIFDESVNVAVLKRRADEAVQREVPRAIEQRVSMKLALDVAPTGRAGLRAELGAFPALADDVWTWVEMLSDLCEVQTIGVRLARLERAMCPRFHVDRLALRLVCTYDGAATEFIDDAYVDRARLGHAAGGLDDLRSGLIRAGGAIDSAATGDVVLLKGEAWPGNDGRGAVHRSPAATPRNPRLVLTLDLLGG